MTTADFAEWFTEAMTGPAVDVDVDGDGLGPIQSYEPGSRRYHDEAPEGRREGERAGEGEWSEERPSEQQGGAASCPSRRVSVGKRDDDGSNGSQPGQESQADCQPQSQPKPRLDPGAIDDAHLIRLVPEQEMNVAFPVGCPVWLNFRIDNYVRHDHGVNEGYDATHGVVRAIFLHSVMQNVVYKVELRHGDDDPAATSLCAFYEDQLAFAAKCPVYLELHDDLPKRTVEGEIVVPRWNWRDWRLDLDKSERNRNVSRVTYTALYSLDGTRVRVQDGLDAKQITFRRPVSLSIFHVDHDPAAIASLPVVQDTSQLYSAALPPHPSIHSEIPSASDYSSHPPHGESAQDTDLGNEYLLALADDQIKFSPPHSYSTAESPHPMGMEAEPAYGAVDATANEETAVHHYGGNGSENTSRFNHDADDNNNTIHLPALAPPPQPQSQSQPQPQLQPQPLLPAPVTSSQFETQSIPRRSLTAPAPPREPTATPVSHASTTVPAATSRSSQSQSQSHSARKLTGILRNRVSPAKAQNGQGHNPNQSPAHNNASRRNSKYFTQQQGMAQQPVTQEDGEEEDVVSNESEDLEMDDSMPSPIVSGTPASPSSRNGDDAEVADSEDDNDDPLHENEEGQLVINESTPPNIILSEMEKYQDLCEQLTLKVESEKEARKREKKELKKEFKRENAELKLENERLMARVAELERMVAVMSGRG
mmetsp:Transcript_22653/g.46475  ORF Transcript_22653/g.46475 Transcript_22653/m.46475 type:complete len:707 (-) Transcript_22653:225-2345(-)